MGRDVSWLSWEELTEISDEYDDMDISEEEIIEKHNIDISSDRLKDILLPLIVEDTCPECGDRNLEWNRDRNAGPQYKLYCPFCKCIVYTKDKPKERVPLSLEEIVAKMM